MIRVFEIAAIISLALSTAPALAEAPDEAQSDIVVLSVQKRSDDVKPIIASVPAPNPAATPVAVAANNKATTHGS